MSFDAILIGAGVNGMTLSAYLQRGGLQTLVVEAELQIGGMARSTRPLLAGFVHNPHANYLMQMDISPVVRDLELPIRAPHNRLYVGVA
ncbi:NAD(P)-binding protein [Rhodococcus erythropolis]|uniref:NAD(P)-binding protein n=1 Tax=Rhodococcus erythropolis TaxID=1833 RepID=UPI003013FCBB